MVQLDFQGVHMNSMDLIHTNKNGSPPSKKKMQSTPPPIFSPSKKNAPNELPNRTFETFDERRGVFFFRRRTALLRRYCKASMRSFTFGIVSSCRFRRSATIMGPRVWGPEKKNRCALVKLGLEDFNLHFKGSNL